MENLGNCEAALAHSTRTACESTFTLGLAQSSSRRSSEETFVTLLPTSWPRAGARAWSGTSSPPLRQTFNQLIEDEVVSVNPAARIGRYLKEKGDPRFRIDPLLPYEEAILLETMQTHYSRHYP